MEPGGASQEEKEALAPGPGPRRDLQGECGSRPRAGKVLPPGPIFVASISRPQSALPIPLRCCQATGPGGNRCTWLCVGESLTGQRVPSGGPPGPAWHLLSSRVLCSALRVRTFTFSEALRGRRGVIRVTAAVLRKRLARPRVGELSQPGRGRGSAPPTARACMGRCGGERRPDSTQQSQRGSLDSWAGGWALRGPVYRAAAPCPPTAPAQPSLCLPRTGVSYGLSSWRPSHHTGPPCLPYSMGPCRVTSSLPARMGRWPVGHPGPNARRTAQHKVPACPYRGTWAAAGAGSSSSSRSSMVVAWSSSGSIRMLALEARSSRRKGSKALRQVEGRGVTGGAAQDSERVLESHIAWCLCLALHLLQPSLHPAPQGLGSRGASPAK